MKRMAIRYATVRSRAGAALFSTMVLIAMLGLGLMACAQASPALEGQGISCARHLALAEELLADHPDSALVHALEAEKHLGELRTSDEKARALILLGDAHMGLRHLPAALSAYQRAQRLVEEALEKEGAPVALLLSRSDVQAKIGLVYFHLPDLDKSIGCYNEALRLLEQVQGADAAELALRKVRIFNNIAGVYIQRKDYATALAYFQQAVEMNRPLDDPRNESSLNNNIGICLMEMGEHERANEFFLKSLAVRQETGDARGQAQVL